MPSKAMDKSLKTLNRFIIYSYMTHQRSLRDPRSTLKRHSKDLQTTLERLSAVFEQIPKQYLKWFILNIRETISLGLSSSLSLSKCLFKSLLISFNRPLICNMSLSIFLKQSLKLFLEQSLKRLWNNCYQHLLTRRWNSLSAGMWINKNKNINKTS